MTKQSKQDICTNLEHHWSKKCSFLCVQTNCVVHQELKGFVEMTLTRVSSHWLWLEWSRIIL